MEARLSQLEELAGGLRQERAVLLAKEFQDRYKAQAQWLVQTKALLSSPPEIKAELYQRRAQLAKYNTMCNISTSRRRKNILTLVSRAPRLKVCSD